MSMMQHNPAGGQTNETSELYVVAQDLMTRSAVAKDRGDVESAAKLLRAAMDVMAEDLPTTATSRGRQPSQETVMVAELLKQDWHEASALVEKTGLTNNRVSLVLARLRQKPGFEVSTAKRYRIVEPANSGN